MDRFWQVVIYGTLVASSLFACSSCASDPPITPVKQVDEMAENCRYSMKAGYIKTTEEGEEKTTETGVTCMEPPKR